TWSSGSTRGETTSCSSTSCVTSSRHGGASARINNTTYQHTPHQPHNTHHHTHTHTHTEAGLLFWEMHRNCKRDRVEERNFSPISVRLHYKCSYYSILSR